MSATISYPDYFRYWGKAQPNENQAQPYHLLVYHCLDVAAIAHHLLHDNAPIMIDLSDYLQIEKHELRALLCFLFALHDLGKFASSFQALFQPENDHFLVKVDRRQYPYDKKNRGHDTLGYCFYQNAFFNNHFCVEEEWNDAEFGLEILFNCVLGHHGKPIKSFEAVDFADLTAVGAGYQQDISPKDLKVANEFISDLKTLFDVKLPIAKFGCEQWQTYAKHVSWQLSGLTMLADWLGSDSWYFRYQSEPMPLMDYWHKSLTIAKRCIDDKGLGNMIAPLPFCSVKDSFGFEPSPLQAWAESVKLLPAPQLFVLEDVTGSGKTEAALTLAHRLMSLDEANGFYFGLPTTATSNAMFDRIVQFMPTLFDHSSSAKGQLPSLVLAHGSKNMNDTFQRLIHTNQSAHNKNDEQTGDEISSQCHAWFASSNKRALLADIGVGTIDQALLAALPKKHQPLRLLGLHRKVLIFDEVHSADSYMFELLKSVLQVHLHQGGHAILLTATLSLDKREELARLWLGQEQPDYAPTHDVQQVTQSEHFPLATQVIAPVSEAMSLINETPIDSPNRVARNLTVDFIHDKVAVIDYLLEANKRGQCSVWVRNTVSDAITAYEELLAAGVPSDQLLLFHSRFALIDRKRIESQVLNCFGKHSTPEDRKGKILVATQVFQESLDADADIMVSDLCPIDYLIQRAGRLHRHQRNALGERLRTQLSPHDQTPLTRPSPTLMIFAPSFSDTPSEGWYSVLFPKSQDVYRHVGQLWLTMRILKQQGCLNLPHDARLLIESVYSKPAQLLIPESLEADSKADSSHQQRKKYTAKDVLINWQEGYCEKSQSRWFASESSINDQANTRFQEMPTCEVVILKSVYGSDNEKNIVFYSQRDDGEASDFELELSTLKIGESMAAKLAKIPSSYQAQIENLAERYRGLEYKRLWLPCVDDNFTYDKAKGLVEIK